MTVDPGRTAWGRVTELARAVQAAIKQAFESGSLESILGSTA
jgi:hypothetical protein